MPWDDIATQGANTTASSSGYANKVIANLSFLRDPPQAHAYSAGLSIASGTEAPLTLSNERWDTDNIHSTSASTERFIVQTTGKYRFTANVRFPANATGRREVLCRFNGATYVGGNTGAGHASRATWVSVEGTYLVQSGQYLEFRAYQDSGTALAVDVEASVRYEGPS